MRWRLVLVCLVAPAFVLALGAWIAFAHMPGSSHTGTLRAPTPEQRATAGRLRELVTELCAEGPRNADRPASLARAADVAERELARVHATRIDRELTRANLLVRREECAGTGAYNVFVDAPGTTAPREIVVIGAHYDSCGHAPGANDNASGVAALCELATRFAEREHGRTVRFIAFANEEPPYFRTSAMGSRVHARAAKVRGEEIVAMLSLETLGCYSDAQGSQTYPIPALGLVYPDRGDFVAFVGDFRSRALVRACIATFRRHAHFPSEGAALPGDLPGVGWSDHESFAEQGWPALMVTDTALFRDANYHHASDTPEKLDYERLARVVDGLEHVLAELAR